MGTPTSIKLDDELKGRVQQLAAARHRSAHWIMREAITQFIEREEKRETFRQECIEAWEEYRATGRHATAEEVDAWLASWGTDSEMLVPECHESRMPRVVRYFPRAIRDIRSEPVNRIADIGSGGMPWPQ